MRLCEAQISLPQATGELVAAVDKYGSGGRIWALSASPGANPYPPEPRMIARRPGVCKSSALLACLAVVVAAANASAEDATAAAQVFESLPGETMDAFIVRLSPTALEATHRRDAEFCGAIGLNSQGIYSLNLVTSGKPWTCTIPAKSLTPGHSWTGYIFHTHSLRGSDGWANADLATPGYLATERKLLFQDRNKMRNVAEFPPR